MDVGVKFTHHNWACVIIAETWVRVRVRALNGPTIRPGACSLLILEITISAVARVRFSD